MNYFYVGLDISKDTFDASFWDQSKQLPTSISPFKNDLDGIDKLVEAIKSLENNLPIWVCFENTGAYHLLVEQQLHLLNIKYSVVPALEIKRSLGITRGKNDKIDANRISQYAATSAHKLKSTKPKDHKLHIISSLLSSRNLLVRNNTSYKNHLKSLTITAQCISLQSSIDRLELLINTLSKEIKAIEKEIKDQIYSCEDLKKTYKQITSIPGIGPLTASTTLVHTDNFQLFHNHKKFSSFCGVAPFEYSSGTSIKGKTRTSSLRNKELKKLFFTAALSAIKYDRQIATYYARKINQGKHKLSVRNAVASKLIARMFAVAKRDQPYVKLAF